MLGRVHGATIFRRRVRRLVDLVQPLIHPGATVLDVGCGDGALGAGIMQLRPDVSLEGVDVLMRERSHIPVTLFDGERLPYPDASWDLVLFVDVLHHVDDPAALLAEARRVARTGIIIKDHLEEGFAAGATLRFMDWVGNAPHGVRLPYNYWSRSQWRDAFATLDLTTERWTERLGLYPAPASWAFDRSLHFVARLGVASPAPGPGVGPEPPFDNTADEEP